jgi:HEAT repeat protein
MFLPFCTTVVAQDEKREVERLEQWQLSSGKQVDRDRLTPFTKPLPFINPLSPTLPRGDVVLSEISAAISTGMIRPTEYEILGAIDARHPFKYWLDKNISKDDPNYSEGQLFFRKRLSAFLRHNPGINKSLDAARQLINYALSDPEAYGLLIPLDGSPLSLATEAQYRKARVVRHLDKTTQDSLNIEYRRHGGYFIRVVVQTDTPEEFPVEKINRYNEVVLGDSGNCLVVPEFSPSGIPAVFIGNVHTLSRGLNASGDEYDRSFHGLLCRGKSVVPYVVSQLQTPERYKTASNLIAKIGGTSAIKPLTELLTDKKGGYAAARVLVRLGKKPLISRYHKTTFRKKSVLPPRPCKFRFTEKQSDNILTLLRSSNYRFNDEPVEELLMQYREFVDTLRPIVDALAPICLHGSELARSNANFVLSGIADFAIQRLLLGLDYPNAEVRSLAIVGLYIFGLPTQEVIRGLESATADEEPGVQAIAKEALAALRSRNRGMIVQKVDAQSNESTQTLGKEHPKVERDEFLDLVKILRGGKPTIQLDMNYKMPLCWQGGMPIGGSAPFAARYRLLKRVKVGDVPTLIQLIKTGPYFARWTAAEALGMIGDTSAIPVLKTTLNDTSPWVRIEAAGALATMGDNSGIPLLIRVAKDEGPTGVVSCHALNNLWKVNSSSAIPILATGLRSRNWRLRQIIVRKLGEIGNRTAIPILTSLLEDDINLAEDAKEAIQKITGTNLKETDEEKENTYTSAVEESAKRTRKLLEDTIEALDTE